MFRLQSDDPAGGGAGLAVQGGQAVDLAGAEYFEQLAEWVEVRFAEQGDVVRLESQFDGFAGSQAGPVDAGVKALGAGLQRQQAKEKGAEQAGHRVCS
ncbi:hypothetical protein D9M68_916120 [compost metagenome]